MPKQFYTERDIEDMVKRGILSLEVNDSVVLTNNAYEKAKALGMQLLRDKPDTPPIAPVRPYLSQQQPKPAARTDSSANHQTAPSTVQPVQQAQSSPAQPVPPAVTGAAELRQRIHSAVYAKMGNQVDSKLLDLIITRVFQSTGIK